MAYLVDGHNLISKMPGISLEDFDDERQLVERLSIFCNRRRSRIEVFFDNAPAGGARVVQQGLVTMRFVRAGMSADQAIRNRLQSLGGEARNWTVVSSDRQVRAIAQAAGARHITSNEFAKMVQDALYDRSKEDQFDFKGEMSDEEMKRWLQLFGGMSEEEK